jgi:YHS domain-containing protein
MEVDSSDAPRSEYQGRTYFFCNEECKSEFDREPQKYTRQQGVA